MNSTRYFKLAVNHLFGNHTTLLNSYKEVKLIRSSNIQVDDIYFTFGHESICTFKHTDIYKELYKQRIVGNLWFFIYNNTFFYFNKYTIHSCKTNASFPNFTNIKLNSSIQVIKEVAEAQEAVESYTQTTHVKLYVKSAIDPVYRSMIRTIIHFDELIGRIFDPNGLLCIFPFG